MVPQKQKTVMSKNSSELSIALTHDGSSQQASGRSSAMYQQSNRAKINQAFLLLDSHMLPKIQVPTSARVSQRYTELGGTKSTIIKEVDEH